MPRARVVEPNPEIPDDGLPAYEHPGLNAWRQSGDYAALSDPSFAEWDWTVYRLHTPEEINRLRPATPRLYLGRTHGPLDLSAIQAEYGGGTFELWGKFDGRLLARPKVDLSGPRRDFTISPVNPPGTATPAPPAPAAAAAPAANPDVLRILENQQRMFDLLFQRLAAPAAPAAAPLTFQDMLAMINQLKGEAPQPGAMAEALSAFKEGIAIRDQLAGGSGGGERDKLDIILERVMPVVERVGGQMLAAAAARGPRIIRPTPPASHADVITPAPASSGPVTSPLPEVPPAAPDPVTAGATEPAPGEHRMSVAIEVLATGLAEGEEPAETADTIARVLAPEELDVLAGQPDGTVMAILRARAGGAFPVLLEPRADAFVGAVLAELRTEPESEPAPAGSAASG